MADTHNHRTIVYPIGLARRVRKLEQVVHDPKTGLFALHRKLQARIDSIFWLVSSLLFVVVFGMAGLMIGVLKLMHG